MATMNVSLPDEMKAWVEAQATSGRYANASDYIRDIIRRDQEKAAKIAHWQKLIAEAEANGFTDRAPSDIIESIISRHQQERG